MQRINTLIGIINTNIYTYLNEDAKGVAIMMVTQLIKAGNNNNNNLYLL